MIDWIVNQWEAMLAGAVAAAALSAIIFLVLYQRLQNQLRDTETARQQWQAACEQEINKVTALSADLELNKARLEQTQGKVYEQQSKIAGLTAELQEIERLQQRLDHKDNELNELRNLKSQSDRQLSEIKARAESDAKYHVEQIQLLNENKELLKKEFSNLANEIFEQKNRAFKEQSSQSMSAMLDPFQKQIEQFRKRVDDIHTQDSEGRGQLLSHLKTLSEMNTQLNKQADDLTKALKGDKKLQGNWGELQVERILESSGLQRGREYEREENFKDEQGKNFRPDFVIHLPEGKHIVIDSKVSLNAYQRAVAAEDDSARELAIREHVAATRSHIRSLSDKNYPRLNGMNAPDFVLMFMPVESAFVAAFEADGQLFNEAFERHIVVVTPTTLLATLRTVANLWVLERQNVNAKELFGLAGKIYDKVRIFGEKMEKLGSQIQGADKSYHDAMNSLTDGRGSMVSYVKRLRELGAPATKALPDAFESADQLTDSHEQESDTDGR